jgi:uncharacterized phage-associated protein
MTGARLDSVAKAICELGRWRVSNLELQKLMYISQMYYMGQNEGAPLVDATFEAWDYGPVEPSLYHKVKRFGAGPIADVFYEARKFKDSDNRLDVIKKVCSRLQGKPPGALVDFTHWQKGAWAKNYVAGRRGIQIPNSDIFAEYSARMRATNAA